MKVVSAGEKTVREILSAVRTEGDAALRRYTKELDGVDLGESGGGGVRV